MGERSGAATQQKRKEERMKRFAPQLPGGNNQAKDEMRKKMLERDRKYKATHGEHYDWRETLDEKCWKGYEKKGMKTMFGKRYPNCVKKSKKKK